MDWQQKMDALSALADCSLHMRKPGDWYVSHNVGIGGDGFIRGSYGNGDTPEAAVNDHWDIYTARLGPSNYVVANGNSEREKRVRWNGYMWQDAA